jgi:hypothetical protein
VDWTELAQDMGPTAISCEYGNEISCFIKVEDVSEAEGLSVPKEGLYAVIFLWEAENEPLK